MDLQRQEYPALLTSLQPEQAINVLDDRVLLINRINNDIADFLSERRKIEEQYASALRKLARRPHADNSAALGVFDMPWQRIVASTETLAQSHENLASKIETDVETPLRQYQSKNREMQSLTTIQGNLTSIAKDLSKAREKADKLNARGGRKADEATSNVDDASSQWESQSPFVFEQLQGLDENRVNHLRDVLTQLQTHELDAIEKGRMSAEACLNALLNVETADEIKTFAAKAAQGRTSAMRRRSSAAADRPRSSMAPPAPPPPRNSDSRHNSIPIQGLSTVPESTPDKKSKMGGLKRLGTVMRGKKGAAPPPPQSASEKKKEKTRSFAPFRRGDSSRSFQDLEDSGRDLTPIASQPDRGGSSQGLSVTEERPPQSSGSAFAVPAELNGVSAPHRSRDDLPPPLVPASAQPVQQAPPPAQTQIPQYQPPPQIPPQSQSSMSENDGFTPTPTDRGYSNQFSDEPTRNLTIRDEPIPEDADQAQLAMNNMANQLRLQAQNSGMSRPQGSVRGRRDVRNTIFVQSGNEIPGFSTISNSSVQPIAPTPVNPATTSSSSLTAASPIISLSATRSSIPALLEEQAAGSDAGSIHSSQTLSSMVPHPELTIPGLNASIAETVSTWFTGSGVTRSFVVGEIAFSHISGMEAAQHDSETIRIQNFQVLEKVAANPAFVTRSSSDSMSAEEQAGSYNISLSAIRRTIPTVGLKYQLHLNEGNLSLYSPILITTAWQILDGQASVIILYERNPDFVLPASFASTGELVVKNVAISVSLDVKEPDAGKAISAMMAPTHGASFRRKASSVVWRFPELNVKLGKERLLVRFMTEGGMPRKGSVELKFEAPEVTASSLGIEKMHASSLPESDPFADEVEARKSGEGATTGSWEQLPTRRMLVSGRYTAA